MAPTIRSRARHQCRAAHSSRDQIQLLRTIARTEASLKDGPQITQVTRSQNPVLEDMDVAWSLPLSPQEKLFITSTETWRKYLAASLKSCKEALELQTNDQVRENRRTMDRRARKAFEDKHKGQANLLVSGRNIALKKSSSSVCHMGSSGWSGTRTLAMQCGQKDWPCYAKNAQVSKCIT